MRPKVTDLVSGYVVSEKFENLSPFFMEPLKSTDISIFFVQNCSGRREVCALKDISTKCILLPYKSGHVLLPVTLLIMLIISNCTLAHLFTNTLHVLTCTLFKF